jgi:hypothetical protein
MARQLQLAVLLALAAFAVALKDGDFIHAGRRAQFQDQRTHFHDLLGHHVPRFGHDRLVGHEATSKGGRAVGTQMGGTTRIAHADRA